MMSGTNDLVLLDQDYGGSGQLRITQVAAPADFVLEVFRAADWQAGYSEDAYAVGTSLLNAAGHWLSPVGVSPGIYNILIKTALTQVLCYIGVVVTGPGDSGPGGDNRVTVNGEPAWEFSL